MTTSTKLKTVYNCSLERAFKFPMLSDLSKVHTGLWIMPAVSHVSEDQDWGQPGATKKVFVVKSLTQKGGYGSLDKVLERIENKYWKIEVSNFQSWIMGFYKFIGEWSTKPLETNRIEITYTYTLHAKGFFSYLFYPWLWLFTKTFWRMYMKQVLRNLRAMAEGTKPILYP